MKFIWEPDDIICGRIICKASQTDCDVDGNSAKWCHKIGFDTTSPSEKQYCLIAMSDGMIGERMSVKEMVETLNNNSQGYAPMPYRQFIKTMEWQRDCFETLP